MKIEDVFSPLPATVTRRITAMAVERSLRSGQVLFRSGDVASGLHVVLSGRIRVSRWTTDRMELLHFESAGGILGEIPVFGGGKFPSTAVAAEPARCAELPVAGVEALLRDSPEFARFAIHRLARRAHSLLQRIEELTTMTIPARVAGFVLERARGNEEFTLGISQSALAEELGTAREVVVRAIGDLVRSGAIRRSGRSRFALGSLTTLEALARRAGTTRD
jgi:CRP/FNR family transcriptional regulator